MLPELEPFFAAVQLAHTRRQRALESSLPPGISVWYRKRTGATIGPVVISGRATQDARIPVRCRRDGRYFIKASWIVSKGSPP